MMQTIQNDALRRQISQTLFLGMAGIINYSSFDIAKEYLSKMLNALSKSPDTNRFIYYDQNIIFGCLVNNEEGKIFPSILPGKTQRIKKKVCSIFSGNILNLSYYDKENICCRKEWDVPTIIDRAYIEKGIDGLVGLNGAWSIAIWEQELKRLTLAIDPTGIKTLYYSLNGSQMYFSTDLRCLSAFARKRLDLDALSEYMHYLYVPSPRTIYAGISSIPPGTAIIFEKGTMCEYKFGFSRFVYKKETQNDFFSEKQVLGKFENLIVQSIQDNRSQTDITGILLSGGKDSSALAIAASIIDPNEFHTFTVGFEDSNVNEMNDAEKVSERLKIPHTAYYFKNKEYFEVIDDITNCFGQPFGDPASFPVFLMMQKLKNGPSYLLDGTGNDWYFGILPTIKERVSVNVFRYSSFLLNLSNWIFNKYPILFKDLSYKLRSPEERFVFWYGFDRNDISNMMDYRYDFRSARLYKLCRSLWDENIIKYKTDVTCEIWEPNAAYRKVEVAARYYSKTCKFPFADKRLSDFVNTLPSKYKFRGKTNKMLLRKLMGKYLPEEILKKPKGSLVFDTSIILDYNNCEALRRYLNNDRIVNENIFSSAYINNTIKRYIDGERKLSHRLFALVIFQSWLDKNQEILDEFK